MPSINFFYSRRFVNAKRETAKRFSLLKNDCFCKTELIIAGFVSLCKTFFNFYSHRFAVSMHIQPFSRRFSHFERLIIHFMGSSAPFSSEGLTFCMIMQDFAFDSFLRACENALSTRIVKIGLSSSQRRYFKSKPKYLRPKVSKEVFGCCCQWQKQTIENGKPFGGAMGQSPISQNA